MYGQSKTCIKLPIARTGDLLVILRPIPYFFCSVLTLALVIDSTDSTGGIHSSVQGRHDLSLSAFLYLRKAKKE